MHEPSPLQMSLAITIPQPRPFGGGAAQVLLGAANAASVLTECN